MIYKSVCKGCLNVKNEYWTRLFVNGIFVRDSSLWLLFHVFVFLSTSSATRPRTIIALMCFKDTRRYKMTSFEHPESKYKSALTLIENYEKPLMIFNYHFSELEPQFMSYLKRYFFDIYNAITSNVPQLIQQDSTQVDIQEGFIHLVKQDQKNHYRLILHFNPSEHSPLFITQYNQLLSK